MIIRTKKSYNNNTNSSKNNSINNKKKKITIIILIIIVVIIIKVKFKCCSITNIIRDRTFSVVFMRAPPLRKGRGCLTDIEHSLHFDA